MKSIFLGDELSSNDLRRRVSWILGLGFVATVAPLVMLVVSGFDYARGLGQHAERLAAEQAQTVGVLERVRRSQNAVRLVMNRLTLKSDPRAGENAQRLLDEYQLEIVVSAEKARGSAVEREWEIFEGASSAFISEARRLLAATEEPFDVTDDFFQLQDESISAMRLLVDASHADLGETTEGLEARAGRLPDLMVYGIGLCLIVSLAALAMTIRTSTAVLRQFAESGAELRQVTGLLVEKQERTARRFSHELHDELGQSLAIARAAISRLPREAGDSDDPRSEALEHVDDSIRSVRELSHLLHPTLLEHLGLVAGIQSLAETFSYRTGIQVDIQADFEGRLPDEVQIHLYRIVQEALTNIARHSGAKRVDVTVQQDGAELYLGVRDNGRGLSDVPISNGFGLRGMRTRAAFAGGRLELQSAPGNGLSISVRVPLPEEAGSVESVDENTGGG